MAYITAIVRFSPFPEAFEARLQTSVDTTGRVRNEPATNGDGTPFRSQVGRGTAPENLADVREETRVTITRLRYSPHRADDSSRWPHSDRIDVGAGTRFEHHLQRIQT